MKWIYPSVIAHRGAGKYAPENTLAAMKYGYAAGYRAVEFDVMLSKDGIPVLMHDEELGRTVAQCSDEAKKISDFTAKELCAMDAGAWHSPIYRGEKVPLYEEIFHYCQKQRITMNVEIKPVQGHEIQTAERVAKLSSQWMQTHSSYQLPLFSSFSVEAMYQCQKSAPHIPRALLMESEASCPDWIEHARALQVVGIHVHHSAITSDLLSRVHQLGYALLVYTINDVERAQCLMSKGVHSFCTDELLDFKNYKFLQL